MLLQCECALVGDSAAGSGTFPCPLPDPRDFVPVLSGMEKQAEGCVVRHGQSLVEVLGMGGFESVVMASLNPLWCETCVYGPVWSLGPWPVMKCSDDSTSCSTIE